ncbi:type 1 fimbrial protein [Salmonella enterica subsp. enterica serovar Minnesota]|nr:type 1 fimbrial protein [Salmonella enterica]EHK4262322.1 type 1 fimbrial protein [Salmonella enterica subsp. enterica serovar Minnesota]EBB5264827.1 type 1 fimbrial protein [Salmonella enterica]EEM8811750.1 hypothetical protein [Salmonella enterica]EID8595681.1 type 1 fimbrial protein [Salmonella enterica]
MKIKNCLFLLGAAMAVMSSSAFADTMGTQTFTANVVANTCAISGLDASTALPDYTRADLKKAGHNSALLPGNFIHTFNVTGCPASVSGMAMTVNYTQAAEPQGAPVPALTGTGKGVALWLYRTARGANYLRDGDTVKSTITNGAGSALIRVDPYGWFPNGDSDIVAGSFTGVINVSFDFT